MRYIDADRLLEQLNNPTGVFGRFAAIDCVESAPAVDAVEVVRCKDCKYGRGEPVDRCDNHNGGLDLVEPDDFCSYGEKREDR